MKKSIQIFLFLSLPTVLLNAQIKANKLEGKQKIETIPPQYKGWFGGLDLMLQTPRTKVDGSANVTLVQEQYINRGFRVGYQSNRHKYELGLAIEKDDASWNYTDTIYNEQSGSGSDYSTFNTRLGYTYQVLKLNKRMHIELGGGLNWTYWLADEVFPERLVQSSNITGYHREMLLRRNSLAIDGRVQLNYVLTPHLQARLFYQYRYAPQSQRTVSSTYYAIATGKILDDVIVTSSATASLIGVGLQYNIQPLFNRKPKVEVEEEIVKGFHVGLQYGFLFNAGSRKATVNYGEIGNGAPIPLLSSRAGIEVGYRHGRHDFEIGFQRLKSSLSYKFGDLQNFFIQERSDDAGENAYYVPLRYYYSLFPKNQTWKIDAGIGVGYARFIENLPSEFVEKTMQEEMLTSGSKVIDSYIYTDKERMNTRETACFEGNIRLRRLFYNDRWQFNIWGRYIWNPWSVRTAKFDIQYSNKPPKFGEVSTSFTSLGLGAGLSYAF